MVDGGEEDDKILAVHTHDPHYAHINELEQIIPHLLNEIENFFKTYKLLENKKVEIKGWVNKNEAYKIVQNSMNLYSLNRDKLITHPN